MVIADVIISYFNFPTSVTTENKLLRVLKLNYVKGTGCGFINIFKRFVQ
ncbi:hypothetical protein FM106_07640 [Brachybacterium faecium]|nr:hypothetical protein FM106_07640 [Brachybacterium faecium]SPN76378.1 conserved hypothetical protein [Brochothrix thermosphacta]